MKKFNLSLFLVFFSLALIASLLIGYKLFYKPQEVAPTIKIGKNSLIFEIADTPEKKVKGLSQRDSLPESHGMLFTYDQPEKPAFWMKGMLISLDFIWINDQKVVELTENVQPENYQPPNSFEPKEEITALLEVKAGTVKKLNIKVGDRVEF